MPHPIYNGAKPEYPCSVFSGAFSVLRRENDQLSYTALQPTSIRFSRDAKTATRDASAERIGEIPCGSHVFRITTPSLPKVVKEREVAAQLNAMVLIGEAQRTNASNRRSQPYPRDGDRAALRHIPRNVRAS